MRKISVGILVKRCWILLIAVAVVGVAGFAVYRLHGIFGSHYNTSTAGAFSNEIVPFNPKHVVVEVFGPPGAVATINYVDVDAQPQHVDGVPLPWSYDTTTTEPAVFSNVVAQGNSDSIGCRISSAKHPRATSSKTICCPYPHLS